MTDTLGTLEEYSHWTLGQSVKGWDTSPAEFMRQKHVARIVSALADIFDVDSGLINHYFEEDTIEWIIAQAAAAKALDRTV